MPVPAKKSDDVESEPKNPKQQIKMSKKKKKCRIGKTPAEKINWTKEEVSQIKLLLTFLYLIGQWIEQTGSNLWRAELA